jgi:hypothetical protein
MGDAGRLLALNALFVSVGVILVRAFGIRFSGSSLPSAVGLAPVVGLVACSLLGAVAATVGLPLAASFLVGVALVVVAASFWISRFDLPALGSYERRSQGRLGTLAEASLLLVLGVLSVSILRLFAATPLSSWDGWAIWAARAHTLFESGDAWNSVFQSRVYASQHPEYPILLPALEALSMHALGRFDVALIDVGPAVLLLSFGVGLWALLRFVIQPWLAAATALVVMGSPPVVENYGWNYADAALASLVALGLVCSTIWLIHSSSTVLCLAWLFLTGACWLKNEGLLFSIAAIAALALAGRMARRPLRNVALLAGSVCVSYLPWLVYSRVNGLGASDFEFTRLGSPSYVVSHADRAETAGRALAQDLVSDWRVLTLVGLLGLVAAWLAKRHVLVAFAAGWAVLGFAGLTASYLASIHDLNWHLTTSSSRVVSSLAVGTASLAPLLATAAWQSHRREVQELVARLTRRTARPHRAPDVP